MTPRMDRKAIDTRRVKFPGIAWVTLFLLGLLVITGCQARHVAEVFLDAPPEVSLIRIPLAGEVSQPRSEFSGLAWHGDTLILLPQYPQRFPSSQDGNLFAIPKAQILAYLVGELQGKITPGLISLLGPGLDSSIPGFEGFEAIAIRGDQVYLTIESRPGESMVGYVVAGSIAQDTIMLNVESLAAIEPQADLDNFSDEALLVYGDQVLTFYEAWGARVNPYPVAHLFDAALNPGQSWPLPNMEYRITDVTDMDASGRFWAINYLYPGDIEKLEPAEDELTHQYGQGASHAASQVVERLVEFQIEDGVIVRTQTAPIQLKLASDGEARNWEGIVRLDDMGFLMVTDQYPETILGFVPYP